MLLDHDPFEAEFFMYSNYLNTFEVTIAKSVNNTKASIWEIHIFIGYSFTLSENSGCLKPFSSMQMVNKIVLFYVYIFKKKLYGCRVGNFIIVIIILYYLRKCGALSMILARQLNEEIELALRWQDTKIWVEFRGTFFIKKKRPW